MFIYHFNLGRRVLQRKGVLINENLGICNTMSSFFFKIVDGHFCSISSKQVINEKSSLFATPII